MQHPFPPRTDPSFSSSTLLFPHLLSRAYIEPKYEITGLPRLHNSFAIEESYDTCEPESSEKNAAVCPSRIRSSDALQLCFLIFEESEESPPLAFLEMFVSSMMPRVRRRHSSCTFNKMGKMRCVYKKDACIPDTAPLSLTTVWAITDDTVDTER